MNFIKKNLERCTVMPDNRDSKLDFRKNFPNYRWSCLCDPPRNGHYIIGQR